MSEFNEVLSQVYLGNSLFDYLIVVGALLATALFNKFLAHRISDAAFNLITKGKSNLNKDTLYDLVSKPVRYIIALLVLFVCTSHLEYPESWDIAPKSEFGLRLVLHRMYLTILILSFAWAALKFSEFLGHVLMARAELTESKADDQVIPFMIEILKILIVTFSIFFTLGAVFKVDVGALIAGLGIGGLALALAAKESLENLLASFVIFFDKPFMIDDLVQVNGVVGTVEKIGFRSTRLRTLEKSYLTLPNRQMIDNTLDNLSMRTFRRVKFNIGVEYGTSETQLKAIVQEIQEYIDAHPNTNQDGEIHFMDFGSSSLDIMVLYFIDTMDWSVYLKIKEEINFEIMRIVQNHGADFAFPTQTIHLAKN